MSGSRFRGTSWKTLDRVIGSSLAHDSGWVFVGQGMSYAFQVGYFILLVRMLGVEQYGVFAGAVALAGIAAPFGSLGAGMLFMQYVTRDPSEFQRYWGNVFLSTAGMGILLVVLLRAAAPHFLSTGSAAIIVPVAIASCLLAQFIQSVVQIFQSYQRMRVAAFWSTLMNLLLFLAGVGLFLAFRRITAEQWAVTFASVSAVIALAGAFAVTMQYGRPRLEPRLTLRRAAEGVTFSVSSSTTSFYSDFDKTLLSHYGMNIANGFYTAGFRIITMASLPVYSVEWASLPRFFQEAKNGVPAVVRQAHKILRHVCLIGALAGAGVLLLSPVVPHLLGQGFAHSVSVLRWLFLLPVFRSVHYIMGAALTGTGYQRYRTAAQILVALLNLGLNLLWIPEHSWLGAAMASLISNGALAAICWTLIVYLARRSPGMPRTDGRAA